ncbi:MAG TPA: hypothetical protein EYP23_00775 [Thermoplasmata archaeon]|nr:hypothetical protein [Thermoplasmata archaeon]
MVALFSGRLGGKRLKERYESAQTHVIDAVIAVSILIIGLIAASHISSNVFSVSTPHTASQLRLLAGDVLQTLDSRNASENPSMTQLEYYLNQFVRNSCVHPNFSRDLKSCFPSTLSIMYNVWLYNSSSDETVLWLPENGPRHTFGTVVRSHRIMVEPTTKLVYDVILEVWAL